jgi:hypothetical protein
MWQHKAYFSPKKPFLIVTPPPPPFFCCCKDVKFCQKNKFIANVVFKKVEIDFNVCFQICLVWGVL